MPIWVKASEKYPKNWKLCRLVDQHVEFPLMFKQNVICDLAGKTYSKENVEWLDTSERSFSIENMNDCWEKAIETCLDNTTARYGAREVEYQDIESDKVRYFKEQYNIDL